ncbi:MAG: crossover junction endodeoxyribonuclease RuvC [Patescibacteria group bacterium]|nr:crossover junction endodeoxyribonuclease RuvC [Patescibacteria group bacterium]
MIIKKSAQIILGIDPGIADTGFGIIKNQNNALTCLTYGSIKTSAKLKLDERLEMIHLQLNKLIQKYRPDLMAVEKLFFCNNAKTALIVGQARGVVMLAARMNKIASLEFTPYEVKQAVSTYGHASKDQVQKMVKQILRLKELPKPDDAADALAIAICAANCRPAGHI